ncbi:heterogeneous nuclear ribonucleo A1 isoform X1, partial [Brachionus plicatilis]
MKKGKKIRNSDFKMSEENAQNDQVVEETQQPEQQQEQDQQQDESQSQSEVVESENNCDQSQNESQSAQLEPEHFRKVFVGGLSYKTDDESFKNYFSKFGELLDLV